jgi:hypothetical protein
VLSAVGSFQPAKVTADQQAAVKKLKGKGYVDPANYDLTDDIVITKVQRADRSQYDNKYITPCGKHYSKADVASLDEYRTKVSCVGSVGDV